MSCNYAEAGQTCENVEIDVMRHTQDRGEDLSPWKTEQDRVAR